MLTRFEQFVGQRQHLSNVSTSTLDWYQYSFKRLPPESPSQDELKEAVLRMREKGLKATGCNSAIRAALNAYLKWSGSSPKIQQLKEPEASPAHIHEATNQATSQVEAEREYQRRLHLLILFRLDTGCRISEVNCA
jgi:integrase/recombinase XerD